MDRLDDPAASAEVAQGGIMRRRAMERLAPPRAVLGRDPGQQAIQQLGGLCERTAAAVGQSG
jgi:hypothetical protein